MPLYEDFQKEDLRFKKSKVAILNLSKIQNILDKTDNNLKNSLI